MSFQTIRPQIATLIDTIAEIQEVSSTPKLKFNGYPAAYVIPSDNESDYETTSENERVYAFLIRTFYETKVTGVGGAVSALEIIVDSVIDKIDQEDLKGSTTRTIGINMPAKYTFLSVFATPSFFAELSGEELVMAEIKVRVRVSVDITS